MKRKDINHEFKFKTTEELMDESALNIIEENKKYNFIRKDDGSIVSDIWFDKIIRTGGGSRRKGEEHNTLNFSGLVYSEPPVKTSGAYPYYGRGDFYNYRSDGTFICKTKGGCGLSGI